MTTDQAEPMPDDERPDGEVAFDLEGAIDESADSPLSEEPAPAVAPRQGVIRRLLNTPLRDFARARFSGRLDLRQCLRDAKLPDELCAIWMEVVNRSRLWAIEKADVGRELSAHFRDGLDDGENAEGLAVAFGPPRRAASLIRRAKRRSRSAVWQVWLRTAQVAGVVLALLVGIYLVATIRLFTGRPVISHDYLVDANATAAQLPADSRAWDVYREALLALGAMPREIIRGAYPGSNNWDAAARYVEQHGEAMDLIRSGAARRGLGYIVGYGIDEADRLLWPDMPVTGDTGAGLQTGMAAVLLPYLDSMSRLSWLLAIDALRAAELGDGTLATANIEAITGIARQTIEVPFILNNLVAFRQASLAVTTLGEILSDRPDVFTDQQLGRLAHRLSALFGGRLRPRLDGERMMIDDLVQRLYTDDGEGNGRLTAQGLSSLGYRVGTGDDGGVNIWYWKADRQKDIDGGHQGVDSAFPDRAVDMYPEQRFKLVDMSVTEWPHEQITKHDPEFITAWGAGNLVSDPNLETPVECLVARGPGTLSGKPANAQLVKGQAVYERGLWYVQLRRAMSLPAADGHGDERMFKPGDYLPVSFAIWNGSAGDRDGKKNISIWQKLVIE